MTFLRCYNSVPEGQRFEAIRALLRGISLSGATLVYGAQDKSRCAGNVVDVCFRACMSRTEEFVNKLDPPELVLLIADECDKDIKRALRKSFREYRQHLRTVIFPPGTAWHFHDDMYFGSSKESIGIQTADLCAYFIAKHHAGGDLVAEEFYDIIKDRIVSKLEPE